MTDPIEGFQLINFDEKTGAATIDISRSMLSATSHHDALTERAMKIISRDSGVTVRSVELVARESDDLHILTKDGGKTWREPEDITLEKNITALRITGSDGIERFSVLETISGNLTFSRFLAAFDCIKDANEFVLSYGVAEHSDMASNKGAD